MLRTGFGKWSIDVFRKGFPPNGFKSISPYFHVFFICLPHAACLLCWMPWLDHFCWVCSHVLSIISQMIAVSMASNWACCYLSPKRLFAGGLVGPLVTVYAMFGWFSYVCVCAFSPCLRRGVCCWMHWPDDFALGLRCFCSFFLVSFHFLAFAFVSCVLSLAGCLGQIILQWVRLDLHVVSLRGCLGRMMFAICEFSFSFIHPQMMFFVGCLGCVILHHVFLRFLSRYVCTVAFFVFVMFSLLDVLIYYTCCFPFVFHIVSSTAFTTWKQFQSNEKTKHFCAARLTSLFGVWFLPIGFSHIGLPLSHQ